METIFWYGLSKDLLVCELLETTKALTVMNLVPCCPPILKSCHDGRELTGDDIRDCRCVFNNDSGMALARLAPKSQPRSR